MKNRKLTILISIVILLISNIMNAQIQRAQDFNFDWKFQLQKDTVVSKTIPLNDVDWREIRLPHDWSVESSFSNNYEGATGYLPGGVAWYQKHFSTPKDVNEKKVFILFDGVYNNAKFYLNGKYLGENPYGYSPVYFDMTNFLKTDGSENVISVYVDHSRYADSRWYTGSGIYRNVKLITTNKLHIPIWGTFVTTPEVTSEKATVKVETKVKNDAKKGSKFTVQTKIIDAKGNQVAVQQKEVKLSEGKEITVGQLLNVSNPKLWDTENPTMYKTVTTILSKGKSIDEIVTPIGIRNIEFKVGEGFYLNGKPTFMKGVCLHHDAGLVGVAVPEGVWRRRLITLKEAGVNAIRTSHNPPSEEFLNLCDEMGLMVQNELFDEFDYPKDKRLNYHDRNNDYITRGYTEHFQKWGKSDLTRSILRDRNHPSIVQWSIGNEIEWTYLHYRYITGFWEDPKDPQKSGDFWDSTPMFSPEELKKRYDDAEKGVFILAETAKRLNNWVKELDNTRTTTANLIIPQVSHVSGYADAVDIVGYSYRNVEIPWAQKHFPHKQVTINECPGTWDDWKTVLENPGVYGMFMWTGIDYLGESNKKWPGRRPWGDILDLAGFKVQGFNYFKSIWVDEPHISIGTLPLEKSGFKADQLTGQAIAESKGSYKWRDSDMHWNYKDNDSILVEVCSNYATVELLLNGKSLGYRSMSNTQDRLMRWVVPFKSGKLEARGVMGGEKKSAVLTTAGAPTKMVLTTDKTTLKADGYDVAHLVVQLFDKDGNTVQTENTDVEFEIIGDAKLLGVDAGNYNKHQDFQSNKIETFKGRCLAIIQSTKNAGEVTIKASAKELKSIPLNINVQQ